MHVEIITPETKIFSGEAQSVQLPGLDGSFQVLNNHAPIISGLAAGTVKVELEKAFEGEAGKNLEIDNNKTTLRVAIKGGVMELLNNKVVVLAE